MGTSKVEKDMMSFINGKTREFESCGVGITIVDDPGEGKLTKESPYIPVISRIAEVIKSRKAPGTIKHTSLHHNDHDCLG